VNTVTANKTKSITYDNIITEYFEMPNKQALDLLDQIIEMADQVDAEYKKKMNASPYKQDWEQSMGEGWIPFHLKRLKELLTEK
tara:strand:+ start:98 stop:349 length:252 start_codon:yes stop_codon:yes gene_type:complete